MKRLVVLSLFILGSSFQAYPQNIKLSKYQLRDAPMIGRVGNVTVHEGGFSGLHYLQGSDHEYYLITDRGPNADATAANGGKETVLFLFPDFAPKILRVRAEGDSLRVLAMMTLKRPGRTNASGLPNPAGFGNTGEIAWIDTNKTSATPDEWGIDSEGIAAGRNNDLWICDEYGVSVWRVNKTTGEVIVRYSPYGNSANNIAIAPVFVKRRPNRGFEGIAVTPNGKVYTIVQSPMYNPDKTSGQSSRLHRILEIDPETNVTRMFAYEHEPAIASIRSQDWKIGDMAAINNQEFLVLEYARGQGDEVKKIFKISLANATPITKEDFGGKTFEQLNDAVTCLANGITPVAKTLFMDLLANGWEPSHDKAEGLTIINDTTIAVINDNDFGIDSPHADGKVVRTGKISTLYQYTVPESMALNFVPLRD
ncbi:MAG: esterase-like activity of phytase family protein [candidate division KSB1 bacterium]|nr:esterase-like activity of phytase family protein [candidate division KSB1 bacterium]MDZ7304407.1 esterase-like activity of phytase family protein [candidate division KSB1 bacterium]MDZ7313357.1 esterase-like activity of phytase family protein [candidate division KSB1 bacterium]